jgi:hypothetical protein
MQFCEKQDIMRPEAAIVGTWGIQAEKLEIPGGSPTRRIRAK